MRGVKPQSLPKGNISKWKEVLQQHLSENGLSQPGDHILHGMEGPVWCY